MWKSQQIFLDMEGKRAWSVRTVLGIPNSFHEYRKEGKKGSSVLIIFIRPSSKPESSDTVFFQVLPILS
jgi:hypothetical protein